VIFDIGAIPDKNDLSKEPAMLLRRCSEKTDELRTEGAVSVRVNIEVNAPEICFSFRLYNNYKLRLFTDNTSSNIKEYVYFSLTSDIIKHISTNIYYKKYNV